MKYLLSVVCLFSFFQPAFSTQVKRTPSNTSSGFLVKKGLCLLSSEDQFLVSNSDLSVEEGYKLISVTKLSGNTAATSTCAYYFAEIN